MQLPGETWMAGFYPMMMTITSVGYGDISAVNTTSKFGCRFSFSRRLSCGVKSFQHSALFSQTLDQLIRSFTMQWMG